MQPSSTQQIPQQIPGQTPQQQQIPGQTPQEQQIPGQTPQQTPPQQQIPWQTPQQTPQEQQIPGQTPQQTPPQQQIPWQTPQQTPQQQQIPGQTPQQTPQQQQIPGQTPQQQQIPGQTPGQQQIPGQTPEETPQQQTPQQPSSYAQDTAEWYAKRRSTALQLTVCLLFLSLMVLTVGLVCATRTDNVAVAGYYPGIILSFGAFLGIIGMHLLENRRHMLMGAIIFISLGVIAAFFCAIIDGIIAGIYIDSQPLVEGSCDFYSSTMGYIYDTYYAEITCPSQYSGACTMSVRSNTCYCCYNCKRVFYFEQYHIFTGVSGCWDVVHLHRLLWVSVGINILAIIVGIISAALLGAYKDLPKPSLQTPLSPGPPPHILYNPIEHMLTYPYPLQHYFSHPALPASQPPPEGTSAGPSDESRVLPPPHPPTLPPPQDLYTLTPNAPALYAASYAPFEKPPPYAY